MTHASLFSGIGGPEVAAEMMGWRNAFHCEINPFGRAVLDYWFPESKSYEDITKTDFREWRGKIDILTGGFPCQPFSYAGKRGGADDSRYLWPQMLRAIDEIRPTWVVGENVAGITTMVEGGVLADLGGEATLFGEVDGVHRYGLRQSFTIERICRDLEGLGYSVQPLLVPAAAVGAPHRRDRIFIIAYDRDGHDQHGRLSEREVQGEKESESVGHCSRLQHGEGLDLRGSADTTNDARDSDVRDERKEREVRGGENPQPSRICEEICRDTADASDLLRDGGIAGHGGEFGGEPMPKFGDGSRTDVAPDSEGEQSDGCGLGQSGFSETKQIEFGRGSSEIGNIRYLYPENRWAEFPSISPVHRGNDGLPFDVDNLAIPFAKWRTESLKAYGNAIVPQVMYRIFLAIQEAEQ